MVGVSCAGRVLGKVINLMWVTPVVRDRRRCANWELFLQHRIVARAPFLYDVFFSEVNHITTTI